MRIAEFLRYRWQAGLRAWRGEAAEQWTVETDAAGVSLRRESWRGFIAKATNVVAIDWCDVRRVIALKQDNLTWDTIWLRIESLDGVMDVPEDAEGWRALCDAMPAFLRGCAPFERWWPRVAFPAFARNVVQVYPTADEDAGGLPPESFR